VYVCTVARGSAWLCGLLDGRRMARLRKGAFTYVCTDTHAWQSAKGLKEGRRTYVRALCVNRVQDFLSCEIS
jgi:hypothetical protein